MIEPRLTAEFHISALRRLVEADGGSAAILRKGDKTSGAILLIGRVRGCNPVLFERFPSSESDSIWTAVTAQIDENDDEVAAYWQKRGARDPDLWVVELDVASAERLTSLLGTRA